MGEAAQGLRLKHARAQVYVANDFNRLSAPKATAQTTFYCR